MMRGQAPQIFFPRTALTVALRRRVEELQEALEQATKGDDEVGNERRASLNGEFGA